MFNATTLWGDGCKLEGVLGVVEKKPRPFISCGILDYLIINKTDANLCFKLVSTIKFIFPAALSCFRLCMRVVTVANQKFLYPPQLPLTFLLLRCLYYW